MMQRSIAILAALLFVALVPIGSPVVAQEATTITKQEMARTKFRDLTERMQKLMLVLQKNDTDANAATDAGILLAGSQYVQEAQIHEHMARARTLIDQERWDDALVSIGELREKLGKLYEILQNRNDDLRKLLERIAQLENFKKRVDELAKEQGEQKEDSARAEALQKLLERAEAKRAEAQALLARQQEIRDATNELGMQAAQGATDALSEKEGDLQEDTEKLAEDLEKLAADKAELDAEAKAAADKAAKAAEAGKPGDKSQPGKPSESKPSESSPGESKPSESEPSESESKPGKGKAGSGSAGKAAGAMGKACESLGDNQPEPSLKDQDHAIENLEKTVDELDDMIEEARRELLKLPFDQMAKKQEKTKHATDTLSKDMEKAEEGDENGEGQPTPGKKRVQQAVPKQRSAAGQLKEYKPAKQKQQDAKEDLEAASKELEEALAQLRQQLQDEVLRALEERFTAMLAVQRELTIATNKLHQTRQNVLTADGSLPAALATKIMAVATGEGDLEVEASDAMKLLEEEGSSVVITALTEDLKDQLHEVAALCRAHETDEVVQSKQKEIEDTLELLINALRRTIERKEAGG